MSNMHSIVVIGAASLVVPANAGILGFAAFSRVCGNGNRAVDLVAVTERPSDRVLNVFNVVMSFPVIQQAGLSTRGFKPDAATSTRSNCVDSFCTIGVQGGAPYYGEYYAAGSTAPDGGFTTGWTTSATTIPTNGGWFCSPPTGPDCLSESLSNFTGLRCNSNAASAGGSFGVWLAHWVLAPSTTSAVISLSCSAKDGLTGTTQVASTQGFEQGCPSPGAIVLLGMAGGVRSRRRS